MNTSKIQICYIIKQSIDFINKKLKFYKNSKKLLTKYGNDIIIQTS